VDLTYTCGVNAQCKRLIVLKEGDTITESSAELTSRMGTSNNECGIIHHIHVHVARFNHQSYPKANLAQLLGIFLKSWMECSMQACL